jgi:antitoxin (DNA-binding transcriptional repressor) of toxin-antitoxin stability system
MVTKTVDISQAPAVRAYLLGLLEKDTEIILTEGGRPLARLTQVEKRDIGVPDSDRGVLVPPESPDDPLVGFISGPTDLAERTEEWMLTR